MYEDLKAFTDEIKNERNVNNRKIVKETLITILDEVTSTNNKITQLKNKLGDLNKLSEDIVKAYNKQDEAAIKEVCDAVARFSQKN